MVNHAMKHDGFYMVAMLNTFSYKRIWQVKVWRWIETLKQKQHTILHFILVIFLLTSYASYGTMYTVFSKLQILLVQKYEFGIFLYTNLWIKKLFNTSVNPPFLHSFRIDPVDPFKALHRKINHFLSKFVYKGSSITNVYLTCTENVSRFLN